MIYQNDLKRTLNMVQSSIQNKMIQPDLEIGES